MSIIKHNHYLYATFFNFETSVMANYIKNFFILILILVSGYIKAQDNIIDQVIWVVGDEAILKSDVERERLMMLAGGQRIHGDPYCFIPEQLALQKLYLDQAKIDSIEVSNSDINKAVARNEARSIANAGSREKLEEYLEMPITQLREMWREQMRNNYLTEEVQKSIVSKMKTLTPSEVRRYYSHLPQDSLPFIPTMVEVQIVTDEPPIPIKEIDRIKGLLRGYTERVNKGENFATLAILYSEDGSSINGGELGFHGRAEWVPEFANAAFALSDPKKVSNIVETEFGYHILQLIERRGDRINVRHILLKPKVSEDDLKTAMLKMDTVSDCIRNNVPTPYVKDFLSKIGQQATSFSFEDAVRVYSSDKDTRLNNGLMVNKNIEGNNYGTSRFIMEELPPDVAKVVNTMKVGEVSKPFRMKMTNGRDGIAIVKLKSKIDGHIANISDDYVALKNLVESRKRQEVLDNWVKKKIADTYIYIDENWRNCDFKYSEWIKN